MPGATVVGVTGSVGKTSTKDLAAAALGGARTWVNERSFNNDQGLPTTILAAPDDTEVMVLEMGMRGFGEIARLVAVAEPSIGVVTRGPWPRHTANACRWDRRRGPGEGRARRGAAVDRLRVLLERRDYLHVRAMSARTDAGVVLFGCRPMPARPRRRAWARCAGPCVVPGGHAVGHGRGAPGRERRTHGAQRGGGLAVAGVLGHDLERAAAALAGARLSSMRMEVGRLASGAILLNDAYNANPTSMRVVLDALAALHAERRIAILGVMAEITEPEREHRAIATRAASLGIELIPVGTDLYGVERR